MDNNNNFILALKKSNFSKRASTYWCIYLYINLKNILVITKTVNLGQLWHKPYIDGGLIHLVSTAHPHNAFHYI